MHDTIGVGVEAVRRLIRKDANATPGRNG
jgi:hypothetical protein